MQTTQLSISKATEDDAAAIAELRSAVAARLTERHGSGHWSSQPTVDGVRRGIESSIVLVARSGAVTLGTLRLCTKKPWAIDPSYFVSVRRPLYLVDMAVAVDAWRRGTGRALLEEARNVTREFPAQAIRLDAYDSAAGAGAFYLRCGFREVGRVVYRTVPLIYFEWIVPSDE